MMLELSPSLKTLINAAHSQVKTPFAQTKIQNTFCKIELAATERGIGLWSWLAVSTATTVTMNSSDSMMTLFQHVSASRPLHERIEIAEFMREIGLRCIGVIGIPQTINMLNAFRSYLPLGITMSLSDMPTRYADASNIDSINARGRVLWKRIHYPHYKQVEHKLAEAHPDLPVFIINNDYGVLFAETGSAISQKASGLRTSLSAIACLRAQRAIGPQLLGHIIGLKKMFEEGSWNLGTHPDTEEAFFWLISDPGCIWLLNTVDELVEALGSGDQKGRIGRL